MLDNFPDLLCFPSMYFTFTWKTKFQIIDSQELYIELDLGNVWLHEWNLNAIYNMFKTNIYLRFKLLLW